IIGFSEVIKMAFFGPLNERYRAYGQDIFSSGIHLLRLINDVLDLSKLESSCVNLHDEDIDPVKLVQASVLLVAPQAARAKIQISEHFEAHLPLIRVDERRIVQVIVNLLSNAVKFSAEGGRVAVEISRRGAGIRISVRDTGIGMAPHEIPKALELFGQIDNAVSRKYEGTGLGLPLAKNLVELHGGTITIESELHVGTTVTIDLPPERIVENSLVPVQGAA
ncbi:MAG TPA: HAMP domain-containing sensor histidine kinase, partial [Chthoniobacterales bacterium]